MYDLTKEASFQNIKKWMEEVKDHAEPDIVIMLVGNKLDLCQQTPSARKVTYEQGLEFAKANNLLFREASAVADINVRDIFENLLQGKVVGPYLRRNL